MENNSDRLNEIINLGKELNSIQDLDLLLERILHEARSVVKADAGSIYICNGSRLIFSHVQNDTLQKKLPKGDKLIYEAFDVRICSSSIAGYVAETGTTLNIPDVYSIPADAPYSFDTNFDILSNYKTQSMLTVPMVTNLGKLVGILQVINSKDEHDNIIPFATDEEPYIRHFSNTATIVLQRAQLTRTLLLRMNKMAELRDPKETGPHVNRVAGCAVELYERWATYQNIARKDIDRTRDMLRMAAILHDVGKVAISDLILKKPGKLNHEEFEIMKQHTFLGARLFMDRESELDEISALVALRHHENWDGTGYPGHVDLETGKPLEMDLHGNPVPLKGDEIHIFGRVVAIADVYDALSSRRVYKDAWDESDVLHEIRKLSGTKFDPQLVEIFFDSLPVMRSIRQRYPER